MASCLAPCHRGADLVLSQSGLGQLRDFVSPLCIGSAICTVLNWLGLWEADGRMPGRISIAMSLALAIGKMKELCLHCVECTKIRSLLRLDKRLLFNGRMTCCTLIAWEALGGGSSSVLLGHALCWKQQKRLLLRLHGWPQPGVCTFVCTWYCYCVGWRSRQHFSFACRHEARVGVLGEYIILERQGSWEGVPRKAAQKHHTYLLTGRVNAGCQRLFHF